MSDIVTRLRAMLHDDRYVELICREAADEIEQLREHRRRCHKDIVTAMNRVQMEVVADMQRQIDALQADPEGLTP